MRRSSARRLINRTSEVFIGDPDLMEVAQAHESNASVLAVVASQLGKPPASRDQKLRCSVLFSEKEQRQIHASVGQMSQNASMNSTLGSDSGNRTLSKKKYSKKLKLRLASQADTILEDMDLTRREVCIQATLCSCDTNATTAEMVEPKSKDACVQAKLCQCSDFVSCAGDCGIIANDITLESAVAHPLPHAVGNAQVPEIGKKDKIVPVSTTSTSEKLVKSIPEESAVVDIEGICSELEACDLDDTVAYDYTCEKSPVVGSGVADQTDMPGEVDKNVSKMADALEPDTNQSDVVLVGIRDVSLQTLADDNVADNGVHAVDMPHGGTDDPSFSDKVTKSSFFAAGSAGSPLLPQLPDASRAGLVHSSANLFSDSFRKSVCDVSSHNSAGDVDDVFESGSPAVQERDGIQSDSILVSVYDVSLQTSALENIIEADGRDSPDAETDNLMPSLEIKADAKSSKVTDTSDPLPALQPDTNRDKTSRSLAEMKLVDEVFESGYAAAGAVGSRDFFPDFDDSSDDAMATHTDGTESDESDGEVVDHDRPTPPDDECSVGRKILTSTTIDSPVAVANFFGLAPSSLSGSDQSADGARRKSKAGRRVSMCGEYDSPTEYFTPHRTSAAANCELSTVADTDEEDDSTVPNANLYATAIEEDLLNSVSELDEDDDQEAVEPSVGGCIPDSPVGGSEHFQNQSLDNSVPHSPAQRNNELLDDDVPFDKGAAKNWTAADKISDSSDSSDDCFEQFIQKAKTSATVSKTKSSNWRAPISDFVVSDDDVDSSDADSDSDSDIASCDESLLHSSTNKENQPSINEPQHSDSETRNLRHGDNTATTSTGRDAFLKPGSEFKGRLLSSDLDMRSKLCTPVAASVLRQRNAPVPHTVGHCHIRRLSFLKSLSADVPEYQRDIEASRYLKQFPKLKLELTAKLFKLYNSEVFNNKLPSDLAISWSPRLTKTAGFCRYKSDPTNHHNKIVSIELSIKVCDSPERLRDTLVHELCHAMVWIEHKVLDGHGNYWKYWAMTANHLLPDLPPISRCHSYEINAKYTYKCSKCGYEIRRHSKSLDISAKVCGYCRAPFQLLYTKSMSSVPRTPNQFALFVKSNYASVQRSQPDLKHAGVMSVIKNQYQLSKSAKKPISFHLDDDDQ